jgi:23S rRNA (uracil1939-C5)-methyltransferase
MKKNDQFEVTIEDMSSEGLGIGRQDGFVWFIKDTVVGDHVLAAATKVKKTYGFARLVRVLTVSPDRVEPPCPIARRCGGCQLQELSYPAQLRFKSEKVYNNLLRIGEVEEDVLRRAFEPIVGMEHPLRYRNKAQFPIARDRDGNIIAGFYAGRTHSVIRCEDCLLGVQENKRILEIIITWIKTYGIEPYHEESGRGIIRHVLIRKGFASGELMVCLVINQDKLPHQEELVRAFQEAGDIRLRSLSYNINKERSNVIMGRELVNVFGPGYIEDSIGSVRFRISPLSFYQVNPVQTTEMYGAALEFADLHGTENVWDLYCGIGTISLFMSQRARHVYGVEIIPEAIEDARQNAELNGISNAEFYVGAAEEVLPEWYAKHPEERIDVVCVDPPRKGCDERALDTIVSIAPERLVYVSCDSATLARDVKYLRAHGYELKCVRPVDNFPMTVHVETVVLMSRKDK